MKATVTITSRGVVTLPARLHQAPGLQANAPLIAVTSPEGLRWRPAVTLAAVLARKPRARAPRTTKH